MLRGQRVMENDLILEPDSHEYRHRGRVVPGVTQLLSQLVDMNGIPLKNIEHAKDRGQKVHRACELYDQNDLDISSLDHVIVPYLEAWILFRKETDFEPSKGMIEAKFFHPTAYYAGTIDRVGFMGMRNTLALVDVKVVAKLSAVTGVQTAAYKELVQRSGLHKEEIERFAVRLRDNGKYEIQQYTDPDDYRVFLSLINLRNWRTKHAA